MRESLFKFLFYQLEDVCVSNILKLQINFKIMGRNGLDALYLPYISFYP